MALTHTAALSFVLESEPVCVPSQVTALRSAVPDTGAAVSAADAADRAVLR